MDRTFLDVNHIKIFFKSLLGAMEIKTKINKRDIIKLQRFYTAKEIILKKIKREALEWEKIFANEAINKGLISKIYK